MEMKYSGLSWLMLSLFIAPAIACASDNDARQTVINSMHDIQLQPGESVEVDHFDCGKNTLASLTVNHSSSYPLLLQIQGGDFAKFTLAKQDGDYVTARAQSSGTRFDFHVTNRSTQAITATVGATCQAVES
ncbi:hypothetical protein [Dyella choica]|uniref:C-type lysozyme inhibitor domain-containing protein n=1 Tax=Dyella choica TaxID=1927959 RepID=A0A432M7A5_9GAMM|nr:hypothetical protein [Dyella choica]RUL76830.1 hypothetical protein EKH80_08985 [Dyella choica]